MKKKVLVFLAMLTAVVGLVGMQSHTTYAANKYGVASKYTTPKKIRGTWVTNDKKSIYKKVVITKHTMKFIRRAKDAMGYYYGAKGKWKLYNQSKSWRNKAKVETLAKADKYVKKHHIVKAQNSKGGTYIYFEWSFYYQSYGSGTFYRSGSHLKFKNIIHNSTFRRA